MPAAGRPRLRIQYNSRGRPMTLRARVMSGLFWVGGTRLVGQVLTWAITIVVIRLLTPGDYGLLAMATVFMGFLSLVAEAGMGLALIQSPKLDDETLRRIFGVVIVVNCALFGLQFVTAPLNDLRPGLGADAHPVDSRRGFKRPVAFHRDPEAALVQRLDQRGVQLQHRLAAGDHHEPAIAAFAP